MRAVILGQAHLRAVLTEYQTHYNTARPHQALEMATPADRFRLAPLAADAASVPVDAAEDHPIDALDGKATAVGSDSPLAGEAKPGATISMPAGLRAGVLSSWRVAS